MALMPPTDAMFMLPESREQPMHVGSLQLFDLPEGAGPHFLRELYESAIAEPPQNPLFRRRAYRSPATLGQWAWKDDDQVDIEHHVRHSALPDPGRVRELLALTSRLHGSLLDRKRPLWEAHLIEGLEGDRFAVYTKLHHALMDGISGMRLGQRALSTDPDARDATMPWAVAPGTRSETSGSASLSPLFLPKALLGATTDAVGLLPTVVRLASEGLRSQATALPLQAPRSMLNVAITGSRRFAAQSWSQPRIRKIGKAADATINDVVLAMCSGALRAYLQEHEALPESPLVAMTPVSLRTDDAAEPSNATGVILCNLATDIEHPGARLVAIRASMLAGKKAMRGLNQNQASALSAVIMAPMLLNSMLALHRFSPPAFNLVISNVPGSREALYWNGAKQTGIYPLSIPNDGQALNITLTSYDGQLHFGLVGCRRSVPHLQRLLGHLEDSLSALEEAVL
ncbi:MAG: Wax ester synthase/acyl-CoA:diacylglycerol acyltransferase [Frankiales bacterium]|jgi:WS/DGAT/MGAT family acyltransferase|nr:Wax ester synthase/acyl-CoA:diacylglycerol acyltransferase [Frankiales bacterium]